MVSFPKGKGPRRPEGDDGVVHSKYITLRNGRRIYASAYGLECFTFVPRKKNEKRK